jgi:hypothetical protein
MTTYSLELLKVNDLKYITQDSIEKYNSLVFQTNADIIDFLQLHYFTKRNDTSFWNESYLRESQSIQLRENGFLLRESMDILNNPLSIFTRYSWILIAHGIEYIENDMFIDKFKSSTDKELISEYYEWYSNKLFETTKILLPEVDYLKQII